MPKIKKVQTKCKKIKDQNTYFYSFELNHNQYHFTLLTFKKKDCRQEVKYKYPSISTEEFKKFKAIKYQNE